MLVLRSVIFQFFVSHGPACFFSDNPAGGSKKTQKKSGSYAKIISGLVIDEGVIHHYPSLKQHDLSISPQKKGQKSQLSGRSAGECGGLG